MEHLYCMNDTCESRQFDRSPLISPKTSNMYEINRASVLAFRAIGKSRSAAAKCLSFFNLKPVYTWHKHTRVIEEKVKYLAEIDFRNAVSKLKQLKRATGHVEAGRDKELEEKEVDIGTSFDCSWSSRGLSARDGFVAAVSEDSGKVLDVTYMTRECSRCKGMEEKRARSEISRIDFLSWYISHQPSCLLNHEGSAQVKCAIVMIYFTSFCNF